jgi:hypothetical protein
MKIPSFGVTHHSIDKVERILDLAIIVRLPPFYDDSHTNHIACRRYVKVQVFVGFRGYQSGWGSQVLLQVFKCLLCLLSPLELVLLLEELKEWESLDAKSREEPAQGSHVPRQLLYIMDAFGQLHFDDSQHLLWVRVRCTY